MDEREGTGGRKTFVRPWRHPKRAVVGASAIGRGKEDATFILKEEYSRLGTDEMFGGKLFCTRPGMSLL